jgi:beta-galactosidase
MGRLKTWGPAWYRKQARHSRQRQAGKAIFLDIDGAMSYSAVWLNGQLVGGWPYGYNIPPGPDALRAAGGEPAGHPAGQSTESARWYPGGGLYRDVWLVKTAIRCTSGSGASSSARRRSRPRQPRFELDVTVDNISGAIRRR